MKLNLSDYRTDSSKKKEGVRIELGGETFVRVASFDNEDFTTEFAKLTEPYRKLDREPDDAEKERIMIHCLARHILLGWGGITDTVMIPKIGDDKKPVLDDDKKPVLVPKLDAEGNEVVEDLEPTIENKESSLRVEWFREKVIAEAKKHANFRQEKAKAVEGN